MPIRITFSAAPANVTMTRTNHGAAGGAAWNTAPPPTLYAVTATAPPGNPWNTPAGRTGTANIPAGGSVNVSYQALGAGGANPSVTITVTAVGGAAIPTVNFNVVGGVIGHSHHTTGTAPNFDIAINFS